MGFVFIQAATNTNTTVSASISVTLGVPPTNGNLLVAFIANQGTRAFADGANWTPLNLITSNDTSVLYWKIAGANESATQTVATSNSTSAAWGVAICEYSGAVTVSPVEASTSNASNTATKSTTTNLDPTDGVERLLIGAAMNSLGNGITWSTQQFNGSTAGVFERADLPAVVTITSNETDLNMWDKIENPTVAGNYTTSTVCSSTTNGSCHMAIFKAVAGLSLDPNHRVLRYAEAGRTAATAEPQRAIRAQASTRVAVVKEQ